jgi:glc operon protein GlcG
MSNMSNPIRMSLLVAAVLLVAREGSAQQPAPAQVPDAMPFDVPYGAAITAQRAAQVVQAVIAEATKSPRNWKLAISVVDPSGELVYFYRMDQTQFASIAISQGKARTAVRFRRPTQTFFDAMQQTAGSYYTTLDPTLVASPGGVPLVEGGRIIGAVGCSGATGAQDHVACSAGAATIR